MQYPRKFLKTHEGESKMISENRDTISRRMIDGLKLNNQKLTQERNELIDKNMLLSSELAYFKSRCADLEEENQELQNRLDNVTLWDLSPEAQEQAGRALARSLLGGA